MRRAQARLGGRDARAPRDANLPLQAHKKGEGIRCPVFTGMTLLRFVLDFGWRAVAAIVWIPAFAGMTGEKAGMAARERGNREAQTAANR